MNNTIGIINYGCGNVGSIQNMFSKINVWSKIITNPEEIKNTNAIILPGVGSYDYAIERLVETNFWTAIKHHVEIEKKPILVICLGMQLLFNNSEKSLISISSLLSLKLKFILDKVFFLNKFMLPFLTKPIALKLS